MYQQLDGSIGINRFERFFFSFGVLLRIFIWGSTSQIHLGAVFIDLCAFHRPRENIESPFILYNVRYPRLRVLLIINEINSFMFKILTFTPWLANSVCLDSQDLSD